MAGRQMQVSFGAASASPPTSGRADRIAWIFGYQLSTHLVLSGGTTVSRIIDWVRRRQGRNGRELAERIPELGADAVDRLLEPDRLEPLSSRGS